MLFATDFSENAERAFELFSTLGNATREVTLLHVETPKDPELPEGTGTRERLDELAGRLQERDIETTTEVRRGDPADEIIAAEAEYEPSTTLVGSRGHSRLRRLLFGSVSEDVVARAHGNVLLVRPGARI